AKKFTDTIKGYFHKTRADINIVKNVTFNLLKANTGLKFLSSISIFDCGPRNSAGHAVTTLFRLERTQFD
ncbi:MAG: hypothetical protein NXI02_08975, partial [Rhodobacteraceae bacterium]|nr:hypothetical protein [Paracoccaceae bacterium]